MRIGEFLVSRRVLTPSQVQQILDYGEKRGLRFGEAGLELGILNRELLARALGPNYWVDFFHVSPDYLPESTKDVFPVEMMVDLGFLPLGFKSKSRWFREHRVLNIGLVDPSRRDAIRDIEDWAKKREFAGVRVYLVLPDALLKVLESRYQVTATELSKFTRMDPTLRMFLDG